MVGRWEENHDCSKVLRQRLKEDVISQLPDQLICHILSHLPTKETVKTSVLSTRWRSLWLWVLGLDFASSEFPDFDSFVRFSGKFFDSSRVPCIHRVKLSIDENDVRVYSTGYLSSWIDSAVKRKIQELDVRCPPGFCYQMPQSLYVCETLVSLKLFQVNLVNVESVSLPCLKTMYLEDNWFPNEATCEKLVSSCPVLEDLKIGIAWNDRKLFRINSKSLKRLALVRVSHFKFGSVLGVVIDAPLLCTLCINDHESESFQVHNLESIAKLNISLLFGLRAFNKASISSRQNSIRSFLPGITKVREMIICPHTFKLIYRYSKLELLPQFDCLSHLCVTLSVSYLKWLPTFLESCPNLKSLILDWNGNSEKMIDEVSKIRFSSVPRCLSSSLEFVDIKSRILGYAVEMKVIGYFLENSTILKKLTLSLHCHAIEDDFVKKLFKIRRCSSPCKVVVVGLEE